MSTAAGRKASALRGEVFAAVAGGGGGRRCVPTTVPAPYSRRSDGLTGRGRPAGADGYVPDSGATSWTVRRILTSWSWVNGSPSRLKLHDSVGVMRI